MSIFIRTQKTTKHMRENPEEYIPHGMYCYRPSEFDWERGVLKVVPCPFLGYHIFKDKQNNGYCSYLKEGDWMKGSSGLLWDSCKACNINDDWENEE